MNENTTQTVKENVRLNSCFVCFASYCEELKKLVLTTNDGSEYEYLNVPKQVFEDLLSSQKQDMFCTNHIYGRFVFKKCKNQYPELENICKFAI